MQTIRDGYRGLSLLVDLNSDRIISMTALALALMLGAWIASHSGVVPLVGRV